MEINITILPKLPTDPEKEEEMAQCPKCGLTLHPVMCYSCPNYLCPSGLGGTFSMGE